MELFQVSSLISFPPSPRNPLSILVFLYLNLSLLLLSVTRISAGSTCPKACFCNAPSKIVYCSRRGLGRIPSGVPGDSLQLNLNGNVFHSPVLQRSNFTDLGSLEHLYLSECGIERIEIGTFQELANLKWLDLSNNRIKSVSEYGFSGLVLQHLFLNGNRHIHLVGESFVGLITTGLYLHDCSLSRLTPDILLPLNASLKYLWLNGNELDRFDRGFKDIFQSLSHLRLASNPLHCNCEVVWLKEFYDKNGDVFKGAVLPSCLTPQKMKGSYFNELSLFDFRCQSPMFSNIETLFGASTGKLKCTASGDPAPTLYWIQPSGKTTKYSPPLDEEIRTNEGVLMIQSKDVSGGEDEGSGLVGMYICVANNEAGNVTLTINVSWPLLPSDISTPSLSTVQTSDSSSPHIKFVIPSTTSDRSGIVPPPLGSETGRLSGVGGHKSSTDVPSEDYDRRTYTVLDVPQKVDQTAGNSAARRQRLFTVSEFVCAVVGAHVGTLLLCVVVIPLIYRARLRKRVLEKQPQQQLHHQLHYDTHIEPQQQQQLLHQYPPSAVGTPSRSQLLHDPPHMTSDIERTDSIYLNGNGSQHGPPHRQLYLTDYLLSPPK